MKVQQLSIDHNYYSSFHIRRDTFPKYVNSWHAHEEFELIYIQKGNGNLFIGDKIITITPDTYILIGPNVPHYWMFENLLDENDSINCIVIHFIKDFAGKDFFSIPELKEIKLLLEDAKKGLQFNSIDYSIAANFEKLLNCAGANKISSFIDLLEKLTKVHSNRLVSDNYELLNSENDQKRMNEVMNFIKDNYRLHIELNTLAEKAKMSKNSFCRYFKQKTSKTPIQFIAELRISHACNLLRNTSMSLKEICFDSGFNNFVSFHKTFKTQLNTSPIQFRKTQTLKS